MPKASKSKVVGIKIDQKKGRGGTSKTYYYKTNKDYKKGEQIRVKVPCGGNPKATVVVADSKRKHGKLKELKEG